MEIDPGDLSPKERYKLMIVTANGNGWRWAAEFLQEAGADVVIAQEHKVLSAQQRSEASAEALRHGFKSV